MSFYSQAILADQPVAYYRLDEISGTAVNDSSGNSYNGTINGAVTMNQQGALVNDSDAAMLFDGSTAYLSLSSALKTDGWTAFSLESWIKLTNNTFTGNPCVMANDYPNSDHDGFQLFLAPASDGHAGYFAVANGTTTTQIQFGSGVLNANTWIHLVATYNGSTIQVYVNGAQVGSGTFSGGVGTAAYPISVAHYPNDSGYLAATVDEVAIYGYTLSQQQITAHYNAALHPGIVITSAGLNLLRDSLNGAATPKITYVALGTSNALPQTSDTLLGNEVFRKKVTSYTNGANPGETLINMYLAPGDAVGTNIQEVGFFGGSSASSLPNSGVLLAHGLYSHTKQGVESIQFQLDFTV